jgi:hypothetical protein
VRHLAVTGPAEQLTGSCDSGMLSKVTNVVQPSPSVKGCVNSIQSGSRVTFRWVRITTVVRKKLLIRRTGGILQNQICLSMTYSNLYTGSG